MNNNMYSDYVEWMNRTWDPDVKEKYDKLMIQFISEPDAQKKQGIEQQLKEIVSKQYDLYTSKAADTMLQSEEKLAELDKEKQRLQNEIANLNSRVYPEHMDNLNVKNELQNVSAQKEELNKQKEEILKKGQERTDVIAKLEKDISDLRDINILENNNQDTDMWLAEYNSQQDKYKKLIEEDKKAKEEEQNQIQKIDKDLSLLERKEKVLNNRLNYDRTNDASSKRLYEIRMHEINSAIEALKNESEYSGQNNYYKAFEELLNNMKRTVQKEVEKKEDPDTVKEEQQEAKKDVTNDIDYDIYIAQLTDEELEKELSDLESALRDEWNFRTHYQNGMEENEDTKLNELQGKINKVKKEIAKRELKKNDLSELTDDELDKLKREKKDKLEDEWNFRAHYQNGMEENEDAEINKLNEEIKAIDSEKDRRKKIAEENNITNEKEANEDKKKISDEELEKDFEKEIGKAIDIDEPKEEKNKDVSDEQENEKSSRKYSKLPVKIKHINRSKFSKLGKVILIAMAAVVAVGLPVIGAGLGVGLASGFGAALASSGLSTGLGITLGVVGGSAGATLLSKAIPYATQKRTPKEIEILEEAEIRRYVSGMVSDIQDQVENNLKDITKIMESKKKCEGRISVLQKELEQRLNQKTMNSQKTLEINAMKNALKALNGELKGINGLLSRFKSMEETKEAMKETEEKVDAVENKVNESKEEPVDEEIDKFDNEENVQKRLKEVDTLLNDIDEKKAARKINESNPADEFFTVEPQEETFVDINELRNEEERGKHR